MGATYHAGTPSMQGKSRSLHRKEVHSELVQVHPDLLQSREMLHHRGPILTPIAGELVAAEWRIGLDLVPGIDPHGAGLKLFRDPMRALDVPRLHTCGQSIDDVIADTDGLVRSEERRVGKVCSGRW